MGERYWEVLLEKWREKKRDGFTIPFIIGSQNYLPDSYAYQNISDLIIDISNGENEIYLTYCMNIGDLILGIRDESKSNIAGKFVTLDGKVSSLYQTKIVNDLGVDVESIIESLKSKYQDDIEAGNYSRNEGELGNYSDSEIQFIKSCFINLNK